jgi:hypothetical protein
VREHWHVPGLADAILPLIRTRADLHRWSAANAHGKQMHDAVEVLEAAAASHDPSEVLTVTQKAIASAVTVILRADDSSGIIGDAVRRLLVLHPQVAEAARPPAARLVEWLLDFQLDGRQDFFDVDVDVVAYAPALGPAGVERYRAALEERAARLGPAATDEHRWSSSDSHTRFVLEHNARRLAVLDRDIAAIIRTHARDKKVAAWLHDTAKALAEIGETDLAIDWARQASERTPWHQALRAAEYWCELLAAHRPDELLDARWQVFDRQPSSSTAGALHQAAGSAWPDHRDRVLLRLAPVPREAVLFVLLSIDDVPQAWQLADDLNLTDDDVWDRLARAYESVDPAATLPIHARLVESELLETGAQHYQRAARRLKRMRALAERADRTADVDQLVAEIRETHRRRPRLLQELDRGGL